MIKLIIFDLDGVLLDSKNIHFEAFKEAVKEIENIQVEKDYHDRYLCGNPTKVKLVKLGISDINKIHTINLLKQKLTLKYIQLLEKDAELKNILSLLAASNFKLACASNSIKETINTILIKLDIKKYFSFIVGNDEVSIPKPSPEMYNKCMLRFGISPQETLAVEDSEIGLQTINNAGVCGLMVKNRQDLTLEKIYQAIQI